MKRTSCRSFDPDSFLRPVTAVILGFLFLYLTLDHGGLYPRSRALMSLLIFTFASMKLLFPSGERIPREIMISGGLYFLFAAISTGFSTDRHLSMTELVFQFSGGAAFVAGYYLTSKKKFVKPFFHFTLALLFFNSILALYYYMLNPSPAPRAFGQFFQSNVLGTYLVIFLPGCLAYNLWTKSRAGVIASAITFGVAGAALVAADSTGAILSAVIPLAGVLFFTFSASSASVRRREILLRCGTLALLTLVFFTLARPGALIMTSPDQDGPASRPVSRKVVKTPATLSPQATGAVPNPESNRARIHFWRGALQIFAWRPLLGSGQGTFGYQYTRYQVRPKFYARYPHNFYLSLLSGTGIFAFLSFMALLFFTARAAFRGVKTPAGQPPETTWTSRGLALGLLGCLIHLFVDVSFYFGGVFFVFWTLTGMLSGLAQPQPCPPNRTLPARLGRIAGAIALVAISFYPFTSYISHRLIKTGENLMMERRFKQAESVFTRAFNLSPLSSEAARQLSSCYYTSSQKEKSLAWINRAISLSPYRARLYLLRGRILSDLGRVEESVSDYKKAIRLDPKNQVMAYDYLGIYYENVKQPKKALDVYRQVYKIYGDRDVSDIWHFRTRYLKPQIAAIYYRMASLYLESDQLDQAVKFFRITLSFSKTAPANFGLGYALYSQKKYQQASGPLLQVTRLDPEFPAAYLYLSYCYREMGDPAEEKKFMDQYLEMESRKSQKKAPGSVNRKKPESR